MDIFILLSPVGLALPGTTCFRLFHTRRPTTSSFASLDFLGSYYRGPSSVLAVRNVSRCTAITDKVLCGDILHHYIPPDTFISSDRPDFASTVDIHHR
jgi:hypothetical protein